MNNHVMKNRASKISIQGNSVNGQGLWQNQENGATCNTWQYTKKKERERETTRQPSIGNLFENVLQIEGGFKGLKGKTKRERTMEALLGQLPSKGWGEHIFTWGKNKKQGWNLRSSPSIHLALRDKLNTMLYMYQYAWMHLYVYTYVYVVCMYVSYICMPWQVWHVHECMGWGWMNAWCGHPSSGIRMMAASSL